MRLQITAGPDAGATIEPTGERFTVGREEVDFLLTDEEVSRRHFELRTHPDGRLEISDLGSRNGTRVNGERIAGPRTLTGGEEIGIGVTTIVVEAPPPPDPGATKVSASPPSDPDATAAAADVPPGLRADEKATAKQPVTPSPAEPPTPPPPPAEAPTPPPPPTPAPPPPPPRAAAPPPPPPSPAAGAPAGQASTGPRVTALVLSIVVMLGGIFALIVVGVALSLDLCDDPGLTFFQDCYDGSSGTRAIGSILSVLGTIASIAFLVFSIRYFSKSRQPKLVLGSGIAAVLLLGVGLAVI